MIEIPVPEILKVGGFDYTIMLSNEHTIELKANGNWGECNDSLRRIRIDTNASAQQFSQTFLHEVIHAVDAVYGNFKADENLTHAVANGFLQVFEQLGIRFVKGETKCPGE